MDGREKGEGVWRLGESFAHLCEDGQTIPIPVGENFWSQDVGNLPAGRLVCLFEMTANWTVWEMHPNGDEWIYLMSGKVSFILDQQDGEQRQELQPGYFTIIPKGIWHNADVIEPGQAIFVTLGEGTKHRPREGA